MISTRIRTLLEPPNSDISVERAVSLLNGTLTSLDSPESDDVLDKLLESARRDSEQLDSQVRSIIPESVHWDPLNYFS